MRHLTVGRLHTAPTIQKPSPITIGRMRILLGTVSPVISEGTEAIVKYFMLLKGSGNKNSIDERRTIKINDEAVVVTGFYTFTRMVEGKPVPAPSRYTMLVTKRGSEWRIAHHHSSPHVLPKN